MVRLRQPEVGRVVLCEEEKIDPAPANNSTAVSSDRPDNYSRGDLPVGVPDPSLGHELAPAVPLLNTLLPADAQPAAPQQQGSISSLFRQIAEGVLLGRRPTRPRRAFDSDSSSSIQ